MKCDIMKIIRQAIPLPIENNDVNENTYQKHGSLFPATIRCIIVGPSNCGKTNVLISLIEHINGLKFENVYVYSHSLGQPKYIYLEKLLKPIPGIGYYAFSASEDILHPSKTKPNSLMVFDDVSTSTQEVIRDYFAMGRHYNVDSFYLCQTYAKIPKHLIRDNANSLIVFKQDDLNLKHIYNDHIGSDMSFDCFKNVCGLCWKDPYGFLTIFKDCTMNEGGRYRKGFDHYIYL
jgi:Poxvirus A32 protein